MVAYPWPLRCPACNRHLHNCVETMRHYGADGKTCQITEKEIKPGEFEAYNAEVLKAK